MTTQAWAEAALLPAGWARRVLLEWGADGTLARVRADCDAPAGCTVLPGPVIPGLPNLHSHAFQRGFAGLTEFRAQDADSFWSWRDLMYRFAARIQPAQLEAIATWLYVEMLEAGYTSVCEFHYLHHDPSGRPYAEPHALSLALLRAARRAGIGMTLLPVLYQHSNFGGQAPTEGQRRFVHRTEDMLRLLERLQPECRAQGAQLGLAPHSLRAVTPASLRDSLAGLDAIDSRAPIHIHIAEQTKEVDDCLAWSGRRPVQWLLDAAPVDERWCLVHATHMTRDEALAAARSGAVAGLCPTTEANLGDGIFDLAQWRQAQGRWGIGSDSHICVNAAEELMLLEYTQRLAARRRNVLADDAQPGVAAAALLAAVAGGAQAAGRPVAGLAPGQSADFAVLDTRHIALCGLDPQDMLSAHVFASARGSAVRQVWQAGTRRVDDGRHALRHDAAAGFLAARSDLIHIQ
ncbi:MAG: formimidoylglutamate deiminase [Alcaligenaceae bacterium]|nr:formimidoylglutamate deiminase [Alcaligenaceae bacterium]